MSPARRTRHTSRPNIALFALFAAIWQVGPAQAENAKPAPASLRRLFPSEADLLTDREGLARVDLPPELLAACRPDLSDLRIFDNDGREVPFLMDRLAPPASGYEMTQRFNAPVLEVARTEIRREKGPPLRRETYDVGLPGVASRTGSWTLIIETDRPEFVCRVSVAGLPSAGKSVSLIENASFFRISGSRPAERLRLPLPIFAGRGLRISLEGEEARYLEPGFRLESARILETPTRISVPLEIVSTENENGATIIELARPRGIVPDLLHIDTSTGTFNRRIEAWDLGQGVPLAPIGEEAIFRVRAIAAVEQADVTLKPARGERLRLRIENGDSPPLEGLAVTAIVRRPSLVFDARPDRSGVAGTLCFGGGRARLPRYDLSGLLPAREEAATGRRAEAAALLVDPASIARSWIGPVRPNPSFDRSPALAFAMRPGAGSETGLYSHRRTLEVAPSPEGLSRMRLAPADLAHLREDLADLRVVDAKSRQWPYLLERDAAVELVALQVESRESKDGVSRYRLALPVVPLRIDGLRFDAEAPFFDRDFRLAARLE